MAIGLFICRYIYLIKDIVINLYIGIFKLSFSQQTLNGLCTAGTKLAQSLQALLSVHDTVAQYRLSGQCLAGWEELSRATNVASNTVKNHVIAALKDHEARNNEGDKHVSKN